MIINFSRENVFNDDIRPSHIVTRIIISKLYYKFYINNIMIIWLSAKIVYKLYVPKIEILGILLCYIFQLK